MKDWDEHPASAQRLVTDDKGNYSVTSKVWLTLLRQDVLAEITCQVTHRDLAAPLHRTMNLSQVLRGEWAGGRGHRFPGSLASTAFHSVRSWETEAAHGHG